MARLGARTPLDQDPDDVVAHMLRQSAADLDLDPLFRRRLRGEVLNRHVAMREGIVALPRPRAVGRLGRAVLLASVTLAFSVTAAGAAAQSSLPGELLYPVKLELESIRLQLATGAAHDDLLSMAFAERLDELERLASAGEWKLVADAGEAVTAAEGRVRAAGLPIDAAQHERLEVRIARLQALLASAPAGEDRGLRRALQVATERAEDGPAAGGVPHDPAAPPKDGNGGSHSPGPHSSHTPRPSADPQNEHQPPSHPSKPPAASAASSRAED